VIGQDVVDTLPRHVGWPVANRSAWGRVSAAPRCLLERVREVAEAIAIDTARRRHVKVAADDQRLIATEFRDELTCLARFFRTFDERHIDCFLPRSSDDRFGLEIDQRPASGHEVQVSDEELAKRGLDFNHDRRHTVVDIAVALPDEFDGPLRSDPQSANSNRMPIRILVAQ